MQRMLIVVSSRINQFYFNSYVAASLIVPESGWHTTEGVRISPDKAHAKMRIDALLETQLHSRHTLGMYEYCWV